MPTNVLTVSQFSAGKKRIVEAVTAHHHDSTREAKIEAAEFIHGLDTLPETEEKQAFIKKWFPS